MKKFVVHAWGFIFSTELSPLRHIPDISTRHYVLQALGLMWALTSSFAIGSYIVGTALVLGHTLLIGAAAVTVATYTAATVNPGLFSSGLGRRHDGEHD